MTLQELINPWGAHRPYARFLGEHRTAFKWHRWTSYNPHIKRAGKITIIAGEIL
jgi:hypothetical protein